MMQTLKKTVDRAKRQTGAFTAIFTMLTLTMLPHVVAQTPVPTPPPPPPVDNQGYGAPPKGGFDDYYDDYGYDDGFDNFNDDQYRKQYNNAPPPAAGGNGGGGNSYSGYGGGAGGARGADFNSATQDAGATIQGGANSRISGDKPKSCLKLDPFTGYGPDIINNFDFPDAEIMEVIKTLGRLTCLNFVFDNAAKGKKISIVSNGPITVGDAWKATLTSLDMHQLTIIPTGKYIRIASTRDAKDKQIKTLTGNFIPNADVMVTKILPIKYLSAQSVMNAFRLFLGPNTRFQAFEETNSVLITDTAANVKKLVDLIKQVDVEGFDESLQVIPIRYASAQDIAKLVDQLLPGSGGVPGIPGAPPGGAPRFRGGGFSARKTKDGGVISHIIPDDRTNAVIVSANAKGHEQVKQLIATLDAKVSATAAGSKIHVIYLQYADAEQVAQTLNNLAANAGQPKPVNASTGAPNPGAQLFEGAIKVSPDKPTNSLVVTGTASDFQTLSRVVAKLDVQRDQVYVEAIIMEMNMSKGSTLGVNIASPVSNLGLITSREDFTSFFTNPLALSGAVLGFGTGKSREMKIGDRTVQVQSVQGLIQAIQSSNNSNVLATPQLLTLDNQEAQIEIADKIPLLTSTSIQGAGVAQSITKENVGLTLKVKPQINKVSNFVKLEIDQKLEDINRNSDLPSEVQRFAFATTSRAQKTTVVVQDGDTVVMGGLVRDKQIESVTKVPLLGDIPILGWLFRTKITNTTKTNLLVFMTPHIIKQYPTMRKILDRKLKERDNFLEKANGGTDPFQDKKMEMVKDLPPLAELQSGVRVENTDIDAPDAPTAPDAVPMTTEPMSQNDATPSARVISEQIPTNEVIVPQSGVKKK